MTNYQVGDIAAMVSSGKKNKSAVSTPAESRKSVHFNSYSSEKEHAKYVKTPFTHSSKQKAKKKLNESGKKSLSPQKRKLSFTESDTSQIELPNGVSKKKKKQNINSSLKVSTPNLNNSKIAKKNKKKNVSGSNTTPVFNSEEENTSLNVSSDSQGSQTQQAKKKRKRKSKKAVQTPNSTPEPKAESGKVTPKNAKKKIKSIEDTGTSVISNSNGKFVKKRKLDDDSEQGIKKMKADDLQEEPKKKKKNKKKTKAKKGEIPDRPKRISNDEATIFVGNLPITYNKRKLIRRFNKFGKVKAARIRCFPLADINKPKKVAAITKDFNQKRSSVVGYVEFEDKASAVAALKFNGTIIEDHHIRVDFATNKGIDKNKAVFVGSLPFDIEDEELWNRFSECGDISSVRVVRDNATLMGKGIGYVNFKSTESVELALKLDGQIIKNRPMVVQRCVVQKKKDKKQASLAMKNIGEKAFGKKSKKKMLKETEKSKGPTKFQGNVADLNKKKKKKPKINKEQQKKKKLVKILNAPNAAS